MLNKKEGQYSFLYNDTFVTVRSYRIVILRHYTGCDAKSGNHCDLLRLHYQHTSNPSRKKIWNVIRTFILSSRHACGRAIKCIPDRFQEIGTSESFPFRLLPQSSRLSQIYTRFYTKHLNLTLRVNF